LAGGSCSCKRVCDRLAEADGYVDAQFERSAHAPQYHVHLLVDRVSVSNAPPCSVLPLTYYLARLPFYSLHLTQQLLLSYNEFISESRSCGLGGRNSYSTVPRKEAKFLIIALVGESPSPDNCSMHLTSSSSCSGARLALAEAALHMSPSNLGACGPKYCG
jgi:hypothetical protein